MGERNEKEAAEKKAKEEAERKAKAEAEQKAKEEAERKVKEEAAQSAKAEVPLQKDAPGADSSGFFPLSQLACPSPWPEGVDPARREDWLSPTDFVQALGMTKEAFSKLPLWKRKKAKESAKLF